MKPIRPWRALVAFASPLLLSAPWSSGNDYTQNFNVADGTADLGDGSVLKGNAAFTPAPLGNQLQLTTNTDNNNSAFHIPAVANSSSGWTATFDFTITDNTANPPAEGFSFSYGSIIFGSNSLRPEEGWPARPNVLSFEIDTAVNGDAEVGPAIGLNRPFNISSVGGSTHSSSLAHTNGDALPDDGSVSGTATISWFPLAGASFTTTGLVTNANFEFIATPTFTGDDAFTFAIAGRTSTIGNQQVLIDNLTICVGAADSDGDGLPDAWEGANGLDPNSSAGDNGASGDPDGDGLTNAQEFAGGTMANNADSDGDTLSDGVETDTGTWVSSSSTGTSPINPDSDADGLADNVETNTGTYVDPTDTGSNPNNPNTDGDALDDGEEVSRGGRNPNVADDPDPDTVYVQNFDGVPDGTIDLMDGSTIVGNAIVFNDALLLTSNTNSQNSAFHIPARVGSSTGWTVKYDYSVMDNSPNAPADGFSFSYGNLPAGGLSSVAEEGFPGVSPCLSFEMDTWMNGDPEVGPTIGVDRPGAGQGTVATINGDILPDGDAANPSMVSGTICIQVLPNGLASFVSTGAQTNANFEGVQTNFTPDDAFTFAFTARTGGANQEVIIDNIELTTGLPDSDGDGLFDSFETANGLDPFDATGDNGGSGDPDGDGLDNLGEQSAGTDPNIGDSDGDGLSDSVEDGGGVYVSPSQTGTLPLNPDSDGDGLGDAVETNTRIFVSYDPATGTGDTGSDPNNNNTDGDSASDGGEVIVGRDPNVPDDPQPSNMYSQDFDAYPDGLTELADGSTIGSTNNSSAAVINQQLRLTEEGVGGIFASFRIPALRGSSEGFTATFDFTIADSPANNNPADGFSFTYGAIPPLSTNDATATGHGAAEEAWPAVEQISFEVDTWDAASDWGVNIASVVAGVAADNAYTNGSILSDGTTVNGTATISWNPADGASFTTTGLLTNADFQNVPIPGFAGNEDFIFAFSARTGGAFEDLFIDNLVIKTGGQPLPLDVQRTASGEIRLVWDSKAGRVYDVVTSLTLDTPINTWDVLIPDIPTTAPENIEIFGLPDADPMRFYAVVEKEAPAFYSDDFENGEGDWLTGVNDGVGATVWELGGPTGFFGPVSGADGSANCWGTDLDAEYGPDVDIYLRSPILDLTAPGIAGATLEFQQFRDTDGIGDFGSVRVLDAATDLPLGADIAIEIGGFDFDWVPFTGDLPPEAVGQMIRLEFQFTSDNAQEFFGWYIDNVEVKLQ